MFITDAQLQTQIEGALSDATGTLTTNAPYWASLITEANLEAFNRIQESFLERGFVSANISQWDYGAQYQTAIGVYLALIKGGGLNAYSEEFLEKYKWYFDRLPDALLVVGGKIS